MRQIGFLVAVVGAFWAFAVAAQDNKVVIELYTSQGCSSCPPADALLSDLAARDDVIALALHVDYWDYIGWKDIFGDAAYTARQNGYARAAGATTIYTPQMVIAGRDHVIGSKPMEVMDLLQEHRATATPVVLRAALTAGRLQIAAQPAYRSATPMIVQVVRYIPEQTVDIRRGENAGRAISYANIVQSWQTVARWDGTQPLAVDVNVTGAAPIVVIVQHQRHGPIVAAVELR